MTLFLHLLCPVSAITCAPLFLTTVQPQVPFLTSGRHRLPRLATPVFANTSCTAPKCYTKPGCPRPLNLGTDLCVSLPNVRANCFRKPLAPGQRQRQAGRKRLGLASYKQSSSCELPLLTSGTTRLCPGRFVPRRKISWLQNLCWTTLFRTPSH